VKLRMNKRIYLIPAGCIVFILFFTVFGDKGLLRIHELRLDRARIETRIGNIRNENEQLKREIVALKSDRRYLERIARKELGLVRNNEIIYQFSAESKQ